MENELIVNGVRYIRVDALLGTLKPALVSSLSSKRSPKQLEQVRAVLLRAVKRTPGSSIEELGKSLQMKTKDLTRPIAQLKANKLIRSRGVKRATRYFAK